jgi:hypothetical protein
MSYSFSTMFQKMICFTLVLEDHLLAHAKGEKMEYETAWHQTISPPLDHCSSLSLFGFF